MLAANGGHADGWGAVLNQGDGTPTGGTVPQPSGGDLHAHPGGSLDGTGPAGHSDPGSAGQAGGRDAGIGIRGGGR